MRIDSATEPFTAPRQLLSSLYGESGRRAIAFVGSGLSVAAGLPTWEGLIRATSERLALSAEVAPALREGRLLDVCEYLAIRFEEAAVQSVVASVIRDSTPGDSRPHALLNEIPFHGIVTTNYDLLCSSVPGGQRWGIPVHHGTSGLSGLTRRPFVFHVHGHVHDERSIVFTKGAYDRFADAPGLPGGAFLFEAFQDASVLFLGFGFRDENIERVLRHLRSEGVELAGNAFAVLPVDAGATDPVRSLLLEHMGVIPVEVQSAEGKAAAVDWWLTNLAATVRRAEDARVSSVVKLPFAAEIVAALDQLLNHERDQVRGELATEHGRVDLESLFFAEPRAMALSRIWEYVSAREARQLLSRAAARSREPAYLTALTLIPGERG